MKQLGASSMIVSKRNDFIVINLTDSFTFRFYKFCTTRHVLDSVCRLSGQDPQGQKWKQFGVTNGASILFALTKTKQKKPLKWNITNWYNDSENNWVETRRTVELYGDNWIVPSICCATVVSHSIRERERERERKRQWAIIRVPVIIGKYASFVCLSQHCFQLFTICGFHYGDTNKSQYWYDCYYNAMCWMAVFCSDNVP